MVFGIAVAKILIGVSLKFQINEYGLSAGKIVLLSKRKVYANKSKTANNN
jgi:hypothetical protein